MTRAPANADPPGSARVRLGWAGVRGRKTTLVQCAWSASRKKASYTQAQFHRLRARRGAKKAVCAVAASILTAAYHMLKDGTQYRDLGPDHFNRRSKQQQTNRLLGALGRSWLCR